MDGSVHWQAAIEGDGRRTLARPIGCVGIGLHTGRHVALELQPAASGKGIRFRREDLGIEVAARFDQVADTRLSTALAPTGAPQARIGTVEHVMAALAGAGVDDALVVLDGPEVPILDGSAEPFTFLIDCAGTRIQAGWAETLEVLRPVRVTGEDGAFAELWPHRGEGFALELSIDFADPAIGQQSRALTLSPESFRNELARARTFTRAEDVARLQAAGLALGGSLDNAVVVEAGRVLNPGGLRFPDEPVRHKLLDVVGDLALAGRRLQARFVGHRTGHALNNRLLRALFADRAAWRMVPPVADGMSVRLPAAASPSVA